MNPSVEATKEFRSIVENWCDARGASKRQLYAFISKKFKRSGYWVDSRDRGVVEVSQEDIAWIKARMAEDSDAAILVNTPQYQCYDCEHQREGVPFYTMIPAVPPDPGAFLCEYCFKGLEERGFVPDDPLDPRQLP